MGWGNVIFNVVTGGVFESTEANSCEAEYLEGRDDGYQDGYQDGRDAEQALQDEFERSQEVLLERMQEDQSNQ